MDHRKLESALEIVVVVLFLMGLLLWAEGRMFFCACGEFRIWIGDTCSSSNSQQLFDPYSFTHILHGILSAVLAGRPAVSRARAGLAALFGARTRSGVGCFRKAKFVIEHYRTETAAPWAASDSVKGIATASRSPKSGHTWVISKPANEKSLGTLTAPHPCGLHPDDIDALIGSRAPLETVGRN